jgi:hypothetical protein
MRARGVVVGVVVVGLLAAAGVVVDRIAASVTESRLAAAIVADVQVTGTPRVGVGGFPFLTQVLAGSIDRVTVHLDAVTFDGVEVDGVDVDARGVATSTPHTVDSALVTGTIPLTTLTRLVADKTGLTAQLAVDGGAFTASATLLGAPLVARLTPRVEAGVIRVDVTNVQLGAVQVAVDALPGGIGTSLRDLQIPLTGLPDGVTPTTVAVVPGGAQVTATGTHVVLAPAG